MTDVPTELRISDNIWLHEVCYSETANANHINNIPSMEIAIRLGVTAAMILEPVRSYLGRPLHYYDITSGYRCPLLNLAVGGSKNSDHTEGRAFDIKPRGANLWELAQWMRDHLQFDQLILEKHGNGDNPNQGWIHCSYRGFSLNRNQSLTYDGASYKSGLHLYEPVR